MKNAGSTVSHNVNVLRRARGWTQEELGVRLESRTGTRWSSATVSAAEKGRRAWTANELAAVAEVFGVEVGELFKPPSSCSGCRGTPPKGFTCRACGKEG